MTEEPRLQVFLCHAHEDKPLVRKLFAWLKSSGYRPWLDEECIDPGRTWLLEIQDAVRASHVFLVCLTSHSVRKKGVIQREIRLALDAATERPENDIYIVPCRMEPCEVPRSLSHWQWVDLFQDEGRKRLGKALKSCQEELAASQEMMPESLESQHRAGEGDDGISEALELVFKSAGTMAENNVRTIISGYELRRDRLPTEELVEWLESRIEEVWRRLDEFEIEIESAQGDGDPIAATLKVGAMAASFVAGSFGKAVEEIREFQSFESDTAAQEEYIVDRLGRVVDDWSGYRLDE